MGIVRPVMESFPYAWIFFVPFILLATFTMLNLFIAIIVNTMQEMHHREVQQEQEAIEEAVHTDTGTVLAEISALRMEVAGLRQLLEQEKS